MPPPTKFMCCSLKKGNVWLGIWTWVLVGFGVALIPASFSITPRNCHYSYPNGYVCSTDRLVSGLMVTGCFGTTQGPAALMWLVTLCVQKGLTIKAWAVSFLFFQFIGLIMTLIMYPLLGVVYGWNWYLLGPAYLAWIIFDVYAFRCIWQYGVEKSPPAKSVVSQPAMMNPLIQQPMVYYQPGQMVYQQPYQVIYQQPGQIMNQQPGQMAYKLNKTADPSIQVGIPATYIQ